MAANAATGQEAAIPAVIKTSSETIRELFNYLPEHIMRSNQEKSEGPGQRRQPLRTSCGELAGSAQAWLRIRVSQDGSEFRTWLPLVEAFRALLLSPDSDMLALLEGRGIGFDSA